MSDADAESSFVGRIVELSLENRVLVALGALVLVILGVHSFRALPIDAVPDVTSVQVQVLTNAPASATQLLHFCDGLQS